MSLTEIEAALEKLTPEELRHLALKSWTAFVKKESSPQTAHECSEEDPVLLAALDEAIAKADAAPDQGSSGTQARGRMGEWISK